MLTCQCLNMVDKRLTKYVKNRHALKFFQFIWILKCFFCISIIVLYTMSNQYFCADERILVPFDTIIHYQRYLNIESTLMPSTYKPKLQRPLVSKIRGIFLYSSKKLIFFSTHFQIIYLQNYDVMIQCWWYIFLLTCVF